MIANRARTTLTRAGPHGGQSESRGKGGTMQISRDVTHGGCARAMRKGALAGLLVVACAAQPGWAESIFRSDLSGGERVLITPELRLVTDIHVATARNELYWADSLLKQTLRRSTLTGGQVTTIIEEGILPRFGNAFALAPDFASNELYWTEGGSPGAFRILRSDLEGANAVTLVEGVESLGIALDLSAAKLYYTELLPGSGRIRRANLDGTSLETVDEGLVGAVSHIELDLARGHMYVVEQCCERIRRANLDGSATIFPLTGVQNVRGMALDLANDHIYFSQQDASFNGSIWRANLDGTGLVEILSATGQIRAIAVDPAANALFFSAEGLDNLLPTSLVAAVLPSSRSVQVGQLASAFATLINAGSTAARGCSIAPAQSLPADFDYQTTDPASNVPTGNPNTPVDIPAGASQSFYVALTPTQPIAPTDVAFVFACDNAQRAAAQPGVNVLTLSAEATPVADVIVLALTPSNDGVVRVPGAGASAAFATATVNVGVAADLTVTADTAGESLGLTLALCQTDSSGTCINPLVPTTDPLPVVLEANATPTFSVFVTAPAAVPFDPVSNRINVRFTDAGGTSRGSASVAVTTASD